MPLAHQAYEPTLHDELFKGSRIEVSSNILPNLAQGLGQVEPLNYKSNQIQACGLGLVGDLHPIEIVEGLCTFSRQELLGPPRSTQTICLHGCTS